MRLPFRLGHAGFRDWSAIPIGVNDMQRRIDEMIRVDHAGETRSAYL